MKKINVDTLTLESVLKFDDGQLTNVCKQLKVKPSKIVKNMVIRIKKHMRAQGNDAFFGKAVDKKKSVKTASSKVGVSKKKKVKTAVDAGVQRGGGKKLAVGETSSLRMFAKRLSVAKADGDSAKVKIVLGCIKREKERIANSNPKLEQAIKDFNKKYIGKKINWNNKLKKAGIWESGMQFLKNYEKHRLLHAKGTSKFKTLLKAFHAKRDSTVSSIGKSIKLVAAKEAPVVVKKKKKVKK